MRSETILKKEPIATVFRFNESRERTQYRVISATAFPCSRSDCTVMVLRKHLAKTNQSNNVDYCRAPSLFD